MRRLLLSPIDIATAGKAFPLNNESPDGIPMFIWEEKLKTRFAWDEGTRFYQAR
jgi:hypothetical protein